MSSLNFFAKKIKGRYSESVKKGNHFFYLNFGNGCLQEYRDIFFDIFKTDKSITNYPTYSPYTLLFEVKDSNQIKLINYYLKKNVEKINEYINCFKKNDLNFENFYSFFEGHDFYYSFLSVSNKEKFLNDICIEEELQQTSKKNIALVGKKSVDDLKEELCEYLYARWTGFENIKFNFASEASPVEELINLMFEECYNEAVHFYFIENWGKSLPFDFKEKMNSLIRITENPYNRKVAESFVDFLEYYQLFQKNYKYFGEENNNKIKQDVLKFFSNISTISLNKKDSCIDKKYKLMNYDCFSNKMVMPNRLDNICENKEIKEDEKVSILLDTLISYINQYISCINKKNMINYLFKNADNEILNYDNFSSNFFNRKCFFNSSIKPNSSFNFKKNNKYKI